MANEEHAHVALPKLYGAPAYARPPVLKVVTAERPFDPDDLPIEAHQTEEDREIAKEVDAVAPGRRPSDARHRRRARARRCCGAGRSASTRSRAGYGATARRTGADRHSAPARRDRADADSVGE